MKGNNKWIAQKKAEKKRGKIEKLRTKRDAGREKRDDIKNNSIYSLPVFV
jgi:hypothetical protein